jgi:hypothetical protein
VKLLGNLQVVGPEADGAESRTKRCSGPCQRELPLEAFNVRSDVPDGRQLYCRTCARAATGAAMRKVRRLERSSQAKDRARFDDWCRVWLEAHPDER